MSASQKALRDPNLRFPQRPRLVADLDVFQMPDGLGIQFRGGESSVVLRGRLAVEVLPQLLGQLDGKANVDEIVRRRPEGVSESDVTDLLLLLLRKGLLADGGAGRPEAAEAAGEFERRQLLFWGRKLGVTRANASAEEVQRRLATARIVLVADGLFGAIALDLLHRSGCGNLVALDWGDEGSLVAATASAIGLAETPAVNRDLEPLGAHLERMLPTSDLLVTATRNAPEEFFSRLNERALRHSAPWLRGNETATHLEIGPYVNGIDSPCFRCMVLRQRASAEFPVEEQLYQEHLADTSAGSALQGEWLAHATAGAAALVAEATRILTLVSPPVCEGAVLSLSPNGDSSLDRFHRVARCPACYSGTVRANA